MQQPFHFANGQRAMVGDTFHLPSGKDPLIVGSLWYDSDTNTDATTTEGKRVNLANCMPILDREE